MTDRETIEGLIATVADLKNRVEELELRLGEIEPAKKSASGKSPLRCRFVTEGGTRFWLPQCMGGAVYGDKLHCTCK